jgi:hypothetical protein
MTPDHFIKRVKLVHDFGVRDVMKRLKRGPGQGQQQRIKDLSQWFHSLSPRDRKRVGQVVQMGVHAGIFDILGLLDGFGIKGHPDKGTLELVYRYGKKRHLLTGPTKKALIYIYQPQVYEQVFGRERSNKSRGCVKTPARCE